MIDTSLLEQQSGEIIKEYESADDESNELKNGSDTDKSDQELFLPSGIGINIT